jgi:Gram-negative bacterial TonB protein C-terminal
VSAGPRDLPRKCLSVFALLVAGAVGGAAQQPAVVHPAPCDSIINAARIDTVAATFGIAIGRADGAEGEIVPGFNVGALTAIASMLSPPRPFRLTVFARGRATVPGLRVAGVARSTPRSPTVTGYYSFFAHKDGHASAPRALRESLVPGLDSAVMDAVTGAAGAHLIPRFDAGEDSVLLELRISTDSAPSQLPFIVTSLPRMPVVDAAPQGDNPVAPYPEVERGSGREGRVLLRFVVGDAGKPVPGTLEMLRATSAAFALAAIRVVPELRFSAATVNGCPVAQVVDYPFSFFPPAMRP